VLRALASLPFMVNWFDEIWQYLEPAWHLVAGPWVQTWDYRAGLRSWLIPELLSVPMGIGHALSPDTMLHLLLVRLTLAALSLVIVGSAVSLGLRLSRLHGILAGFVAATWFELVYFAPRALSEPIGLALLMGAIWLLLARNKPGPRQFALAGLLMGLCFVARIQYAPALLTLAILTARKDWRGAWLPLVAGGCAALAIDALANLAMGAVPFRWMIEAARINILEGRAQAYGTMPFTGYFTLIAWYWYLALVPILLLAWLGAKRYPALLWIALVHLAAHSLIGHKEYRFVLASTALLVILAAIGSADLLRRVPRQRLALATLGALAVWGGASATLAAGHFRPNWSMEADLAEALEKSGRPGKTCGLALYRPRDTVAGSYALYRRATPIYVLTTPAEARRRAGAFDVVVAPQTHLGELPRDYVLESCAAPGITDAPGCVLRRAGSCAPDPNVPTLQQWLEASGN
jgi:phosphatidylinositol glycan class B